MKNDLSFEFSFTNTIGNVDGTVTGVIDGLKPGNSHFLGQVTITSFPSGPFPSGLNLDISTPYDTSVLADLIPLDTFKVTSGAITDYQFEAFGSTSTGTYDLIFATPTDTHPLEIFFKNLSDPSKPIVESGSITFTPISELINWGVTTRFDPSSLTASTHGIPIPSYGNYGGSNYSAGVEGGNASDPNAPPPVDALDSLFYQHDLVYQNPNSTAQNIADADVTLVAGMSALAPTLGSEALLYDSLATIAIGGKILNDALANPALFDPGVLSQVILAAEAAIPNFETALAETPGNEARSLNGAFHVFEAKLEQQLASVALLGNYMASTFVASSDSHGGTSVIDPPALGGVVPLVTAPHA
jgi:hypothetical protein